MIRATIKGNVAVAAAQGTIGGVDLLADGAAGRAALGVLMAFLSLLPAVGAALIWVSGGDLLPGRRRHRQRPRPDLRRRLRDRPGRQHPAALLVGKDTQMPDYVVLMSTIGGIALFGINGFVIGPVIAALFMAAWDLFASSNEADDNAPPPIVLTGNPEP